MPAQYLPERIAPNGVQELLRRVTVKPSAELSAHFPGKMPCRVAINLRNGRRFEIEKQDHQGFHTRPMSWESVVAKFHQLAPPFVPAGLLDMIGNAISELPNIWVKELTALLGQISQTQSWRVSI